MPHRDTPQPNHSSVNAAFSAIAAWVNKYRTTIGSADGLERCGPDDVMQIAKDLGVPASELRELVRRGPGAADLLQKMLLALDVDPKTLADGNPLIMRDLQRLCTMCDHKKQCAHELANETAAEHYRDFCPNAFTLDALFKRNELPFGL